MQKMNYKRKKFFHLENNINHIILIEFYHDCLRMRTSQIDSEEYSLARTFHCQLSSTYGQVAFDHLDVQTDESTAVNSFCLLILNQFTVENQVKIIPVCFFHVKRERNISILMYVAHKTDTLVSTLKFFFMNKANK